MKSITIESIEKALCENREQKMMINVASALIKVSHVQNDFRLATLMGLNPSLSNQEAASHWIRAQLQKLETTIEHAEFDVLRRMFETYLFNLNDH